MSNNPSQNNPTSNNTHGLNFNGSTTNELNNYSNTLPLMTSQNTHHLNAFCGHEDHISTVNNNTFPANPQTVDNVHYHQQPMLNNIFPANPPTVDNVRYHQQ